MSRWRWRFGPAVLAILAVALPGAVWMTTGSTQGAFTDVEEFGQNRLGTERLDIEIGTSSLTMASDNVAPGDRLYGTIQLINAAGLPARYQVDARVEGAELAPWVSWSLASPFAGGCSRSTPLGEPVVLAVGESGALLGESEASLTLEPTRSETICLVADVAIEAPNSVQGHSISIELVVNAEHDIEATEELGS